MSKFGAGRFCFSSFSFSNFSIAILHCKVSTANLAHLLRESVGTNFLITYGSIFFIFYVLGLYWFGVRAGITSNSALTATLSGGFLGFLAYGTYGLTNYIFFKGYPLSITVLDVTWGSLLGGAVSLCGYLIFLRFFYQS